MFAARAGAGQPAISGPLRVSQKNPRYFETPGGQPVLLVGAHTWDNLQDVEVAGLPRFDWPAYVDFLERNHHNFARLWRQESARWMVEAPGDCVMTPQPWRRVGPGLALDGKPRFDLTQLDEAIGMKKVPVEEKRALVERMDAVLGLGLMGLERADLRVRPKAATLTEAEIEAELDRRQQARADKDFAASDAIRDALLAKGIEVMDGDPLRWDWKPVS